MERKLRFIETEVIRENLDVEVTNVRNFQLRINFSSYILVLKVIWSSLLSFNVEIRH